MAYSANGGNNIYLDCGSAASLDNIWSSPCTLTAWINATGYGGNGLGRLLNKSNWLWSMLSGSTTIQFQVARVTTSGVWRAPTAGIALSTIYHVAVSYDASNVANNPVMYIDGASVTVTRTSAAPVGAVSDDSSDTLRIGNNTGANRGFNGLMGDIRIYNRICTPNEIQNIARSRGNDKILAGLLGRWKCFGVAGATITTDIDLSGNGNHAVAAGSPTYADGLKLRYTARGQSVQLQ